MTDFSTNRLGDFRQAMDLVSQAAAFDSPVDYALAIDDLVSRRRRQAINTGPSEANPIVDSFMLQPTAAALPPEPSPEEEAPVSGFFGNAGNIALGAGERALDLAGGLASYGAYATGELEKILPLGAINIDEEGVSYGDVGPADETILGAVGQGLSNTGLGYSPNFTWDAVKGSEGLMATVGNTLGFALEQGLISVPDMAMVMTVPAAYVFARAGELSAERARALGKEEVDAEDLVWGTATAVASAAMERLGTQTLIGMRLPIMQGVINPTTRLGEATYRGITEALTEAAQEGIEYGGVTGGTGQFTIGQLLDNMAAGGVAGGIFGGAVGGIAGPRGEPAPEGELEPEPEAEPETPGEPPLLQIEGPRLALPAPTPRGQPSSPEGPARRVVEEDGQYRFVLPGDPDYNRAEDIPEPPAQREFDLRQPAQGDLFAGEIPAVTRPTEDRDDEEPFVRPGPGRELILDREVEEDGQLTLPMQEAEPRQGELFRDLPVQTRPIDESILNEEGLQQEFGFDDVDRDVEQGALNVWQNQIELFPDEEVKVYLPEDERHRERGTIVGRSPRGTGWIVEFEDGSQEVYSKSNLLPGSYEVARDNLRDSGYELQRLYNNLYEGGRAGPEYLSDSDREALLDEITGWQLRQRYDLEQVARWEHFFPPGPRGQKQPIYTAQSSDVFPSFAGGSEQRAEDTAIQDAAIETLPRLAQNIAAAMKERGAEIVFDTRNDDTVAVFNGLRSIVYSAFANLRTMQIMREREITKMYEDLERQRTEARGEGRKGADSAEIEAIYDRADSNLRSIEKSFRKLSEAVNAIADIYDVFRNLPSQSFGPSLKAEAAANRLAMVMQTVDLLLPGSQNAVLDALRSPSPKAAARKLAPVVSEANARIKALNKALREANEEGEKYELPAEQAVEAPMFPDAATRTKRDAEAKLEGEVEQYLEQRARERFASEAEQSRLAAEGKAAKKFEKIEAERAANRARLDELRAKQRAEREAKKTEEVRKAEGEQKKATERRDVDTMSYEALLLAGRQRGIQTKKKEALREELRERFASEEAAAASIQGELRGKQRVRVKAPSVRDSAELRAKLSRAKGAKAKAKVYEREAKRQEKEAKAKRTETEAIVDKVFARVEKKRRKVIAEKKASVEERTAKAKANAVSIPRRINYTIAEENRDKAVAKGKESAKQVITRLKFMADNLNDKGVQATIRGAIRALGNALKTSLTEFDTIYGKVSPHLITLFQKDRLLPKTTPKKRAAKKPSPASEAPSAATPVVEATEPLVTPQAPAKPVAAPYTAIEKAVENADKIADAHKPGTIPPELEAVIDGIRELDEDLSASYPFAARTGRPNLIAERTHVKLSEIQAKYRQAALAPSGTPDTMRSFLTSKDRVKDAEDLLEIALSVEGRLKSFRGSARANMTETPFIYSNTERIGGNPQAVKDWAVALVKAANPDGGMDKPAKVPLRVVLSQLQDMALEVSTDGNSPILSLIRKLKSLDLDVPVYFVHSSSPERTTYMAPKGSGAYQFSYDRRVRNFGALVDGTRRIGVLVDETRNDGPSIEHIILHEIAHAATMHGMMTNPKLFAEISEIYREVKRRMVLSDRFLGMQDEFEFVSEFYTNTAFQSELKNMRATWAPQIEREFTRQQPSVFKRMIHAIGRFLFGYAPKQEPPKTYKDFMTAFELAASVVDRALTPESNILRMPKSEIDAGQMIVAQMASEVAPRLNDRLTAMTGSSRRTLLGATTLRQIERSYSNLFENLPMEQKPLFNPLTRLTDLVFSRGRAVHNYIQNADKLSRKWAQWQVANPKAARDLDRLMAYATVKEVDPDPVSRKATQIARAAIDTKRKAQGKEPREWPVENPVALQQARALWTKIGPEGQKLYREVRDYYRDDWERISLGLKDNILSVFGVKMKAADFNDIDLIDTHPAFSDVSDDDKVQLKAQLRSVVNRSVLSGPYFPLRRFGEFVVSAEVKEKDIRGITKAELDKMLASPDGWRIIEAQPVGKNVGKTPARGAATDRYDVLLGRRYVAFYESEAEALNAQRQLIKEKVFPPDAVRAVVRRSQFELPTGSVTAKLVDRLREKGVDENRLRSIQTALIELMPETSVRKAQLQRRKISGFNEDMRRAFSAHAQSAARYVAQLEHGRKLYDAMSDLREAAKALRVKNDARASKAQDVYNELTEREKAAAKALNEPQWANFSTDLGFVWYLVSPSYWVVNATQPILTTMPYLASRYGTAKASRELWKAVSSVAPELASSGIKQVAGFRRLFTQKATEDLLSVAEDAVATLKKSKGNAPGFNRMLDHLVEQGLVDMTFALDLASSAEKGSYSRNALMRSWSAVMEAGRVMPHIVEVNNRLITASAAYNLSYQKAIKDGRGTADAQIIATRAAVDAVDLTQFGYDQENSPRYFSTGGPLGALARPVLMFKKYAQHLYYLMGRSVYQTFKGETKQERSEALKTWAGLMLTHSMAAGVLGGVMFEPLKWAIGLGMVLFGDPDDPQDFETLARNWAADTFGPGAGEIIMRGLPRAIGIDLSSRVGLDTLVFFEPRGETSEEKLLATTFQMLGPIGAIGLNMARSADALKSGNAERAVQLAVPKGVRDILRSMQYGSEGMIDTNGNLIRPAEDIPGASLFYQFFGFTPADVAEQFEYRAAIQGREREFARRRARLLDRFYEADSADAKAQVVADITAWNRANPERRITRGTLIRSRRERQRREDQTLDLRGVYTTKTNARDAEQFGRFANF